MLYKPHLYFIKNLVKKFFRVFAVTPSHRLSVSRLRVTGAFPFCHTPVTHSFTL